jgi:hypothetical protein
VEALLGEAPRRSIEYLLAAAFQVFLADLGHATSAPELLPAPWGSIGQWLPPGAGATLLRAVEYFGGARSGQPWAVLAAWACGGLVLVVLSRHRRAARPGPVTAVPPQEHSPVGS